MNRFDLDVVLHLKDSWLAFHWLQLVTNDKDISVLLFQLFDDLMALFVFILDDLGLFQVQGLFITG